MREQITELQHKKLGVEEDAAMHKEWKDVRRKYGWFSFLWRGLAAFQEVAVGLGSIMPRGKERLLHH
ncbi:hypothetical protein A3J19_03295 [Candidatus Daviesbacteria bacterium RIFCSPLOWO2_02_FULL_41_8]|uniref:Uncharacterized protein n=3 Tax=Candidatus Daviesiibacteriota TaxID=1752718 RepID=A0A1F5NM12_9BACT|nr:MAG: hypothetical protein A2871_02005 [Candidatus Daviesbacteria bacterium RIFCSPHIGHO2_01_FULL_41_23]OGE33064.1 MAG: hypothetical protein A3D83_02845 [Candidatus Daviesbacteria bacterium RIFCSPHIGHO2_02_FULL_41_10]OGE78430.1 MAG: hypothetical protein A3J19_03295 [Candidatus Daviesbacteria bacterium RIFCSPLOWO2_02_FULL_41_8]